MVEGFNIQEAREAQAKFCDSKGLPLLAPESGKCFSCRRNIYRLPDGPYAISVKSAGATHITGCPHCNRSYCD